MKLSKNRYLQYFALVTVVLALIRCAFPQVAQPTNHDTDSDTLSVDTIAHTTDSIVR